jgi:hypothetical protein
MTRSILIIGSLVALSGCSFYARGSKDYREAVRTVLDTKSGAIEGCYKSELQGNDKAQGKVVVHFDVAPKTGEFTNADVVKDQTTANKPLQKCVLSAIEGLKLDPPDARKGDATFAWDFSR